ncbi:AAA family ATPase [Microbacterium sp. SMR1]|uniref:AAA family ATPase n=1 Tax=Microbacterium sp. SMR1 TaxID=1497340 RepID=UPI000DCD37CC|nr:AAA family ATPase [Microbacterium sp. SMR1]RAZ31304.1 hypothetical protein DO944_10075 [Microbacterium sp. SMR1]
MPSIPAETSIPVYLARELELASKAIPEPALVVVPVIDGWDDFSTSFRAALHFTRSNNSAVSVRLMFADSASTGPATTRLLGGRPYIAFDEIEEPFVSILGEAAGYRTLVERLGFEHAVSALRRMRDLVVAELEGIDEPMLQLSRSKDFAQGVLRDDATWTAYRQGGRYLTPTGAADVDDAARSFEASAQLPGMRGAHILDADFGSDFPLARRSLVLVGQNGVGKTRFLRSLIDGLQTAPDENAAALQHPASFEPRPRVSRVLVFSSTVSDPYPAEVPPWRGLDYRYHRMVGHPPGADDDLARSLVDCLRSAGEVEGLGARGGIDVLDAVLEPLGIRDELHVEVKAVPPDADALPPAIAVGGRLYLPFFHRWNEQRRLHLHARMIENAPPKAIVAGRARDLSSGEQTLLRFAVQAIGSLRTGSLLIFDEPETHLHPHYVSTFMSILDALLEASHSIALIATHSVYVVREVPARRVRIVRHDRDGEITMDPPRLQTFGASIDSISSFVFGDVSTKHRFQQVLDEWLAESPGATVADFRERFREDLNAETLSYFAQRVAEKGAK